MDKATLPSLEQIHCACVIHGSAYDWTYVDKLYGMLCRNLSPRVILHVYTEADRFVPEAYVKHALPDLAITDAKRLWWYKIALFDPVHHAGPLLYFDLDTVIVANIDWIWKKPLTYFWAVQDFKALWRPTHQGINSSVMWWDTTKFGWVWESFQRRNLREILRTYHGDQDFISEAISENQRRFLDVNSIKSWRWQCLDGGYDFKQRLYRTPGIGTHVPKNTSIMVFHGRPKPAEILDSVVQINWRA